MTEADDVNELNKLDILCSTQDGFQISEYDWNLRREGDIFDDSSDQRTKQHGAGSYKAFSVLDHYHLVTEARAAAKALVESPSESDAGIELMQAVFCNTNEDEPTSSKKSSKVSPKAKLKTKPDAVIEKEVKMPSESRRKSEPKSSNSADPYKFDAQPSYMTFDDHCVILFDLETTGFSRTTNRIIQIAAKVLGNDMDLFSRYVRPADERVSDFIAGFTGISQSFLDSEGVDTASALDDFTAWVRTTSKGKPVILVAHNGRRFDVPFLASEYHRHSKLNWVEDGNIFGFADSYLVLKRNEVWANKGIAPSSFKQVKIYAHLLGAEPVSAHNAIADVSCLEEILEHVDVRERWRSLTMNSLFCLKYT
jgi:DNA polymerase III epsilon subunit-like protein